MHTSCGVLVIFFLMLGALAFAETKPAHPEMLVSTEWLASHLHDANLVLIQIGPKQSEYEEGHIPGAHFLPTEKIAVELNGVRNQLPPLNQLVSNLEAAGIRNN